jgi:hypothetical protein
MFKFTLLIRSLLILFASIAVVVIFFANYTPFGIVQSYQSGQPEISDLAPSDRMEKVIYNGETLTDVKDDLVYFSTKMPFQFDRAIVKIKYQNQFADQRVDLGFQDKDVWHYFTKSFEEPFFLGKDWNILGDGPYVYQRENEYKSADEFMTHPPTNGVIGTFDYDSDTFDLTKMDLQGYQASNSDTVIDTPLRGKHILYAYVGIEPFKMTLTKQDLNWYSDPDPVEVSIYKNDVKVYDVIADDDGITDNSNKVTSPDDIVIQNPGPGLPEPGVYKIVIDASPDILISKIKTNLHKVVVEGPIYAAENSEVFPGIIQQTKPTILYTNAKQISAQTFHSPGLQDITITDPNVATLSATISSTLKKNARNIKKEATTSAFPNLHLNQLSTFVSATPSAQISKLWIPKSDTVIKGYLGYFAFSPDQLFYPTAYSVLPLTSSDDISKVDYILTNYRPPEANGDWKTATVSFDLSQAVVKNGKLSWLIRSPNLKENGHNILIKNIKVQLIKNPSFHWPWEH